MIYIRKILLVLILLIHNNSWGFSNEMAQFFKSIETFSGNFRQKKY